MSEEESNLATPLLQDEAAGEEEMSTSADGVARLKDELADVHQHLRKALRLRGKSTYLSDVNKHAGHVDVDFVRTKPSGRARMMMKKKEVKTILHQFYADFPEGCVTALMGPSGAGKTTLLDFLTGMLGDSVHASGQVALPDNDAYVPQDDRLHGFYACRAYMEHYARLTGMSPLLGNCCGGGGGGKKSENGDEEEGGGKGKDIDVDGLIADILSEVGLSAQANTIVGGLFKRGLSGGQKRRLSVALEALSSPLNLFLDEPTSGLDSESALALMQYLHRYARGIDPSTGRRRRVIVTIHQPSSQIWEAIDNVVLLAGGHLMYQGPRQDMEDFFGAYGHPVPVHYNPADHFIEVLFKSPETDAGEGDEMTGGGSLKPYEMWSACFKKWNRDERAESGTTAQEHVAMARRKTVILRKDPSGRSRKRDKVKAVTGKSTRSAIELMRRSFVSLLRNPIVLGLRTAIYGGMSLMIGILFFGLERDFGTHAVIMSRTALLYFVIAFCSSMSVASIPFSIVDRAIVDKEVRNHMFHPAFYHAAQALASVPVCLVLSVVVTVIVLGMTGIHGGVGFGLILFLTFLCADATSMFVANISPELISAICISSGLFGVFTMVMGFLVLPSDMGWLVWLYYVPFMSYSFRSLMYVEYHGMSFHNTTDDDGGLGDIIHNVTGGLTAGDAILKNYEMEDVNVKHDMIVLFGWACIAHTISILYLCWTNYKSRRVFVYSDGD